MLIQELIGIPQQGTDAGRLPQAVQNIAHRRDANANPTKLFLTFLTF